MVNDPDRYCLYERREASSKMSLWTRYTSLPPKEGEDASIPTEKHPLALWKDLYIIFSSKEGEY